MLLARFALPALLLALTGCAGALVVVAEPDRVVLGGEPWHDEASLQPQADRICGQGSKRAVFTGKRQAGTISGWHYTYRCQ